MTKKKPFIFGIVALVFLVALGFTLWKIFDRNSNEKPLNPPEVVTTLDREYVGTDGKQIEIAKETEDVNGILNNLIENKKSFVIYVSLPICEGSTAEFKSYVHDFQKENSLSFYYLTSDYAKETMIFNTVKYFPSVIIVKEGEIVKYLRYDSDEDAEYYKSYDGFSKWFKNNVEY